MATTPIKAIERYKKYMSTHNSREVEEEWKAELRKEYRKQTLAMAREVSASGTYEKVEGMICDWWFEKIDHQLQKAREEVINSVTITVLNSRTLEETTGIGVRESTARAQVCVDIRTKLLDHSELDQNITK